MSFGLLNIGTQALNANSSSLAVVGQNIANVNTEGYNRQTANWATREGGNGVVVSSVERIVDQFLAKQLRGDSSTYNFDDQKALYSSQLDNILASASSGLDGAIDKFFTSMQNIVDDPTSIPNRNLFLEDTEALARRFNTLDDTLNSQIDVLNNQFSDISDKVNVLTKQVAQLNEKIQLADAKGTPANELYDQRDQAIKSLSEIMEISVSSNNGGVTESIFIGSGVPLVVGIDANEMVVSTGNPRINQYEISVRIGNNSVEVTDQIKSGQLGGLIDYRDSMLNPAINEIGRIGLVLAETMNAQHQKGVDLNGNLGGELFNDINDPSALRARILPNHENKGPTPSKQYVYITDITQVEASDYNLKFTSIRDFSITRESDGQVIKMSQLTQVTDPQDVTDGSYYVDWSTGELTVSVDGFRTELEVDGGFRLNNEYLIQPARYGARDFDVQINAADQLALGSPVRITENANNQGNGIALVEVDDVTRPTFTTGTQQLTPPVEVVFNNTDPLSYTVYDISDPDNPVPHDQGYGPMKDISFTAGDSIDMDGYTITINNQPKPGDRFTFDYNSDGVSDNRNALAMSNLQSQKLTPQGTYQQSYDVLVETVSSQTANAKVNLSASDAMLQSTVNQFASVSGVNMDEEAAKLVQFQQGYQAAAQLISASQTIFDSLLNSL
ncbi:flagellar hook-associated protein FlgK [Marinobacterium arenosum]|uniref:flagellar hook-associated protein FlgK n=1 Tax=Marinobacterium arenosum TaxID=2862496 RepID=UPI001C98C01D|nr:flagellar hook-associated protein FlgK [Marinobacterium arenosum]MBY4675927.1 flagellar hook-associated protein FlgK [Marinobacterium arenosum]